MKTLHIPAFAAAVLCFLQSSQAQLFVEHFSYGNGNLGNAGIGDAAWTGGDGPNVSLIVSNTASLSWSGLSGAAGSGVIFNGSTFKKKAAPFASQSGNGTVVYCSFLLRIQNAPTGTKAFLYLQNGNSASSSPPLGIFLDSSSRIGLGKSVSSPSVTTASGLANGTHLIVVRYTFQGGNDQVDLWLDPVSLGNNAAVPGATLTTGTTSSSDASALSYLFLNHAVVQTVWVDEVRVGTSWADVTPTTGSGTSNALPYVTQIKVSPGGVVLRGTNGPANGPFDLLSSADLSTPISQWAEIASDLFDSNGHFDSTSAVPLGVTRQFYRLRVGVGTGLPVAPSITSQPTNRTAFANQTVAFTASATGTLPLSYQWYFNTNTLLPGATSATLTLANVQTNDQGAYSVIVTNIAGAATSTVATLSVSNLSAAPSITSQPQSQTLFAGQNASFSVTASGTPPLYYQWYFNTDTVLADQTNASLTLISVQTNSSGAYSAIVTNSLGSATSAVAVLTVNPAPTNNSPDFGLYGFATENFNLTGAGSNAPSVVVSNAAQLDAYTDSNSNIIVYVQGTIPVSGMSTHVRANKTIIGLGTDATLVGGGLYLYGYSNIIVRNLIIRDSSEDNIGIHKANHIWIDHCTIVNATDGGIDITQQSDNITISWCHFYYESNQGHNFVNLIAASDSDSGNYRVTFHHNWWSTNCVERMPSVRFGRAHVYNNYYNAPGNDYCVRTRIDAQCLVENNYFQNVSNPWEQYITSGTPGLLFATNNAFANVTWTTMYPGTDSVFTPPYSYNLDSAALIPNLVTNNAGAGKGPFAP